MENASKALIMAGAILVAIVIVSMGVMLIAKNQGTVEQGANDADIIAQKTFNSMFYKYSGTIKGSTLKQLFIDVKSSNNKYPTRQIFINGSNDSATLSTMQSGINSYNNYTVKVEEGADGYVNSITY